MFNANMPSLSDIAAVTGNDRDGGWGGNGWWIIIILLAMWGGFGGYGWGNGGYGNGGGYVATAATQADIQRGFDTQNIISKLDGINYGMCDWFLCCEQWYADRIQRCEYCDAPGQLWAPAGHQCQQCCSHAEYQCSPDPTG